MMLGGMFLSLLFSGCTTPPPPSTPAPEPLPAPEAEPSVVTNEEAVAVAENVETNQLLHFEAVGVAFVEDAKSKEHAKPAKVFQAEGVGLPATAATGEQIRLTALAAAQYRALANLLAKLEGMNVTRDAHVVDMAFANEVINVSLDGYLEKFSVVSSEYDKEVKLATVVVQVSLAPPKETDKKPKPELSMEERKARAAAAARIQATALLREKIGQVYVEQDLQVEDFAVKHQEARSFVRGLMEGVQFSAVRWLSEIHCEVTASLDVDQEQLDDIVKSVPAEIPEAVDAAVVE
jgi:enamine deaminase RidA (YjgF/YER057c/UK114 family)